jgi:murein DD-endopeptidase MepM/ murein hydrolase activator NlpD
MMKSLLVGLFLSAAASAQIPADLLIELPQQTTQGALVTGRVPPGSSVRFGERQLRVSAAGDIVFGLGRDAPAKAVVTIVLPGGKRLAHTLTVKQRAYQIERINGLPAATVNPSAAQLARMQRDEQLVVAARLKDDARTDYLKGFIQPVPNRRFTGFYGSQRVLNGEPKRPHFGLDMAAPSGTPIVAPAGAIVTMAERDLFLTGGTVTLDHGHGINTTYLHLSRVDVRVGQRVEQGATIGAVGMTGRATGPHLCWRLNWFLERLDPELVLQQ